MICLYMARRYKRCISVTVVSLLCVYIYCIRDKRLQQNITGILKNISIIHQQDTEERSIEGYVLTESDIENWKRVEFHKSDVKPVIPHIIHQQWNSKHVPRYFYNWTKSLPVTHPGWEFWFWTMADADCLIKTHYSKYLGMYRNYKRDIFKMDSLRYFILYHYGGVYLDIDYEAVKPIEIFTYDFSAVLTNENVEHSYILNNREKPCVINSAMASRPKHPFFYLTIKNLLQTQGNKDLFHATGPNFLQQATEDYKSHYCNNTSLCKKSDEVTILHPQYWSPQWDKDFQDGTISDKCKSNTLHKQGKEVCKRLLENGFKNDVGKEAFLNHHWAHMWFMNRDRHITFNIKETIPHFKLMSDFLKC